MSLQTIAEKIAAALLTGKLNPWTLGWDIANSIMDEMPGGKTLSEEDEQKAIREEKKKDANKRPPKGNHYPKGKPIVLPPQKDAPKKDKNKNKEKPVPVAPYKLPDTNNKLPAIDPFLIPRFLIKRVRAISGESVTKQDYGEMIQWPIVYSQPTFNVVQDVIGTGRREANKKKGVENFLKWFTRNNGNLSQEKLEDSQLEGGGILTGDNFWDQCATIVPRTAGDFTGPMGFELGAAAICDRYADLAATRRNCFAGGVRSVVYAKKPIMKIVPSGTVDISDRFPSDDFSSSFDGVASELKDLFEYYGDRKIKQLNIENSSQGSIKNAIGSDYPILVPTSLVNHSQADLEILRTQQITLLKKERESAKPRLHASIDREIQKLESSPISEYKEIQSLQDHINWLAQAQSELNGALPFELMLEESDLIAIEEPPDHPRDERTMELTRYETVGGKKRKYIKVPSLADAIADIYLKVEETQHTNTLQLRYLMSILPEVGQTRQQTIKVYSLLDTFRDWFGISTLDKTAKVQFTFDPLIANKPKKDQNFQNFLTPAEIEVPIEELDLKTEKTNLMSLLENFKLASEVVIKSMTTSTKDKKKWMDMVKRMAGIDEFDANDPRKGYADSEEKQPKDDLDVKLEQIETGFVGVSTTKDQIKPYSKPFDERPKIVRVTKDIGKEQL
jgi:hypothetical protein